MTELRAASPARRHLSPSLGRWADADAARARRVQPTVGINNFKAREIFSSACFRINNEYLGSNNDAYYLIKSRAFPRKPPWVDPFVRVSNSGKL